MQPRGAGQDIIDGAVADDGEHRCRSFARLRTRLWLAPLAALSASQCFCTAAHADPGGPRGFNRNRSALKN